jgi:hypothetical protein
MAPGTYGYKDDIDDTQFELRQLLVDLARLTAPATFSRFELYRRNFREFFKPHLKRDRLEREFSEHKANIRLQIETNSVAQEKLVQLIQHHTQMIDQYRAKKQIHYIRRNMSTHVMDRITAERKLAVLKSEYDVLVSSNSWCRGERSAQSLGII